MHNTFEVSKRFFIIVILAKLMHFHTVVGFISNTTSAVSCQGSTAKIDFDFDLQGNTAVSGSKVWFFKQILIAEDTGSGFTALNNYSSRLTNHSSGLTLSNVMTTDAGKYTHEITLVTGFKTETATASLTVYIGPTTDCSVYANQTDDLVTCYINTTGGSCGNPELKPEWMHLPDLPSSFICTQAGTYQCCATGPARTVCLPSSSYCVYFNCSSKITTNKTSSKTCELELGCGIGLGLGIQCVITCIVVVMMIFVYKGDTYAYKLGQLHGLGLGGTFHVGWIIIVSLISTGNQCKLELGLGLGLGSGMPCVIACIIAVIFMFVEFKGIPSKVNIGKGILTGLLVTSVIGIIVVYLLCTKPDQKPPDQAGTKPDQKPPDQAGTKPDQKPPDQAGQKNKTKDTGPPAVHTGTQNKVEPKTTRKQTNDIHQPLQHEDTGVEDTPKICPLPQPPQNSDIKDRNQRGISASINDAQGLANETPQNNKLPPLKVVSEETKKKRKKKKKKGQMNDGNPEEDMVPLKSTRTLPVPGDKSDGD